MSRIIAATDRGVNERGLSAAVSGFFKGLIAGAQAEPELFKKLGSMKDFLNKGLELSLMADEGRAEELTRSTSGLSYCLNRFFYMEGLVSDDGQSAMVKGFDLNFDRVEMMVKAPECDLDGFINLGTGDPRQIDSNRVGLDEETIGSIADYLNLAVGNEDASIYFRERASAGDLMGAAAASIAIAARENGQGAAYDFVQHLNKTVSGKINSGQFGLQGWRLGRDYSLPGAPVPGPGLEKGE